MNFLKKIYCRTYQSIFRLMLPVLPYREPKVINNAKELAGILVEKGIKRVLLVTDKGLLKLGLIDNLANELRNKKIRVFTYSGVVPNPTTQNVEDCVAIYNDKRCEAIIAFGGGSPIDCAKAVGARVSNPKKSLKKMKGLLKVRNKLPLLIAVPTTAGTGSETTLAAVITDGDTHHKYVINDFDLIPQYTMLDPELTVGLPPYITATTGMDALTHAVEAYIGRSTTKETRQKSLDAVKLIMDNLLLAYHDGENRQARENMLKASYFAGVAFTKSYVGYVHAIAHTLGGKYNVAHGLANAVILPYVLKSYGYRIHKKLCQLAMYAGLIDEDASVEEGAYKFIKAIEDMNKEMGIPNKIDGIQLDDIPLLAKTADKEANPLYPVPRLYSAKQLEKFYYEIRK